MKVTIENHTDATVVKLQGRIDIGAGDVQLRECLHQLAETEKHTIILDCAKVSYMDSSGLGELVAAHHALAEQGIELCLSRLNPRIYNLLDLTSLITIFAVYDSNEDAFMHLHAQVA